MVEQTDPLRHWWRFYVRSVLAWVRSVEHAAGRPSGDIRVDETDAGESSANYAKALPIATLSHAEARHDVGVETEGHGDPSRGPTAAEVAPTPLPGKPLEHERLDLF